MNAKNYRHLAFVFSGLAEYPPNAGEVKNQYVSRELVKRGIKVSWIQFGAQASKEQKDGIQFVTLPARLGNAISVITKTLRFCIASKVRCIYLDEWSFFRSRPFRRLGFQFALRLFGMRFILDQRDPYLDFEVASGRLTVGSNRFNSIKLIYSLTYKLTDLIILSSAVYANEMKREGVPDDKLCGSIRGVDQSLFNPRVDGSHIRKRLGLDAKFVIGWFGMMHRYRRVNEVLIPLTRNIGKIISNSHILIGGRGELKSNFEKLREENPGIQLTLLGFVPHEKLPEYLSACDVLLCPISTDFKFTKHSAWLKILEAIAVGRPIIATRTNLSTGDYRDLKGVIWAGSDSESFAHSLVEVKGNYQQYVSLAQQQASAFDNYTLDVTMKKIVDKIVSVSFS